MWLQVRLNPGDTHRCAIQTLLPGFFFCEHHAQAELGHTSAVQVYSLPTHTRKSGGEKVSLFSAKVLDIPGLTPMTPPPPQTGAHSQEVAAGGPDTPPPPGVRGCPPECTVREGWLLSVSGWLSFPTMMQHS